MTARRICALFLLMLPWAMLLALLALGAGPDDPRPEPGVLLAFPSFGLIRALGVALLVCWCASIVYVLARALREPADRRAALLLLLIAVPGTAFVVTEVLPIGPLTGAFGTALQVLSTSLLLTWPTALLLILGHLLARRWRMPSMYAALTVAVLPVATITGPYEMFGSRAHWSPQAVLRLPDGRTYHLLTANKPCVNRDVLLEQTRKTPLRLEGRVLTSDDAEGGGPVVVRPAGTSAYDPPAYDAAAYPSPRRLIAVSDGTLLLALYYTHYETGKVACAASLEYDLLAGADQKGARHGPFVLLGPNDELNRADVEALLKDAAYYSSAGLPRDVEALLKDAAYYPGPGLARDVVHPNPRVRSVVAQMLGSVSDEAIYDPKTEAAARAKLLRRLASDPDPTVRRAAAQALKRLGRAASPPPP